MTRNLWISRAATGTLAVAAVLTLWNLAWVVLGMWFPGNWPWLTTCLDGSGAPYPSCYQHVRAELGVPPPVVGPSTIEGTSGYFVTGPTEVAVELVDPDHATRSALHAGPAVWWLVILAVLVLLMILARRSLSGRIPIAIGVVIAIGGSLASWLTFWGQRYAIERYDNRDLLRSAYDFSYLPLLISGVMVVFVVLVRANRRLRADVDGLV